MNLLIVPFHDSPAGDYVREYRLPEASSVPRVGDTVLLGSSYEMTVETVIWNLEVMPSSAGEDDKVEVEIRGTLR